MLTMIVCGIDPGLTGGLAFLEKKTVNVHKVPIYNVTKGAKRKKMLNTWQIISLMEENEPDHVYIEKQQAMPKQGLSSTFITGFNYGIYIGLLIGLCIPFTEVSPRTWKKALSVSANKDEARKRASELMPNGSGLWPNKSDDGLAEAALIAYFGVNSH